MGKLLLISAGFAALLSADAACAGGRTGNLNVSATVIDTCRFNGPGRIGSVNSTSIDSASVKGEQVFGPKFCTQGINYQTYLTISGNTVNYMDRSASVSSDIIPGSSEAGSSLSAEFSGSTQNRRAHGSFAGAVTFTIEY